VADNYTSMAEVKAANEAAGYHFFDPDTMLFFNSQIHGGLLPGDYFVTSESYTGEDDERRYTVRRARANGSIETVGGSVGFHAYRSFEDAMLAVMIVQASGWIGEREVAS